MARRALTFFGLSQGLMRAWTEQRIPTGLRSVDVVVHSTHTLEQALIGPGKELYISLTALPDIKKSKTVGTPRSAGTTSGASG